MGYSISVSVRGHRLKAEMHQFLRDLYRPWHLVAGYEEERTDFTGPLIDDELTSADGKCAIGFNYDTATQPERAYVFALIRWMAVHIGRRKSQYRNENLQLPKPVPYWVYDGLETFPILIEDEWDKDPALRLFRFDKLGLDITDRVARELAWYCIPEGTYEKVSAMPAKSSEDLREVFVEAGLDGANKLLRLIRSELARLDVLWTDR